MGDSCIWGDMKLTQKQETFTQNLFKGLTQREAWIQAGYSSNYALSLVDSHACRLANRDKIKARYAELTQKAEDASIAIVKERKQRLTVFVREDNYSKFGINRQGNIQAIAELNKMEKIYAEGNTVNVDNRTVNIYTNSEKAKELTEKLIEGERTE